MLGADVGELYKPLLTVQIIGVVFILVLSLFLGVREKRRIVRELGALPAVADLIKLLRLCRKKNKNWRVRNCFGGMSCCFWRR